MPGEYGMPGFNKLHKGLEPNQTDTPSHGEAMTMRIRRRARLSIQRTNL
jgi:hypothetical protein